MPSLHGYELDCDRPLNRSSEATGSLATLRVTASGSSPLTADGELVHLVLGADGHPARLIARSGSGLLAWHADAGSFAIDAEAMAIAYRIGDAVRSEGELRWEDRFGSTAMPLLGGLLGGLPLHASANLIGDRGLVICGVSGRGKSTLAAALAAHGDPLLAEDGVVVRGHEGRPVIWPGMAGALVTEPAREAIGGRGDAGGDGRDSRGRSLLRVPAASESAEVAAVAVLAERNGASIQTERLGAAKGHREVLSQVLAGGRASPGAFSAAARLAEETPVFLVRMPDRLGSLEEAAEILSALVRSDTV